LRPTRFEKGGGIGAAGTNGEVVAEQIERKSHATKSWREACNYRIELFLTLKKGNPFSVNRWLEKKWSKEKRLSESTEKRSKNVWFSPE